LVELNKVVFNEQPPSAKPEYTDGAKVVNQSKATNQSYVEEESYENPQNVSRVAYPNVVKD